MITADIRMGVVSILIIIKIDGDGLADEDDGITDVNVVAAT
jgi:hypothetical protein